MIGPRTAVPLTDTAATPPGWATIADGDAQLSVPADWRVATTPVCGRAAPGYVVLGKASTSLVVRNPRCRQAPSMAAIQPQSAGLGQTARPMMRINGIPVVGVRPPARGFVSYLAPALHAVVTVKGPLARRVLATLTRSPLSVVLAPGPQFAVPHRWRWHDFGGIRFATPARWRTSASSPWDRAATRWTPRRPSS